jgi:hypothetical protein
MHFISKLVVMWRVIVGEGKSLLARPRQAGDQRSGFIVPARRVVDEFDGRYYSRA